MNLEKVNEFDYSQPLRLFGFGILLWLIPFLVSFLLYTPAGTPVVGIAFFNSIMGIILIAVAAVLLYKYFRHITVNYLGEAIKVGVIWFLISVVLDVLILVPFTKMDLGNYAANIALGYVTIIVMALFAGYLLESKGEHNKKIYSQIFSTKK